MVVERALKGASRACHGPVRIAVANGVPAHVGTPSRFYGATKLGSP
jgi:hypothetical protein